MTVCWSRIHKYFLVTNSVGTSLFLVSNSLDRVGGQLGQFLGVKTVISLEWGKIHITSSNQIFIFKNQKFLSGSPPCTCPG